MSLFVVLLAAGGGSAARGSGLVWHEGRLVLKGEPGRVEFSRILDPASYLLRLRTRSPVPPAPAAAVPVESRFCAPGAVEPPREKGLYFVRCGDASALAVRSPLALVCVADGETAVSFCADRTTGAPRAGAEVSFLGRRKVLLSGRTDARGLFKAALTGPLTAFARDGDDLAFAVLRGLAPSLPAPVGVLAVPGGALVQGSPLLFFGFIPQEAGRLLAAGAPGFGKTLVRADGTGGFTGRLEPRETRPGGRVLRLGAYGVEFDVVRGREEEFELRIEAQELVAPGEEVRVEVTAREPFGRGLESAFEYAVVAEKPRRGARLVARGRGQAKGRFSFSFRARAAGFYRLRVDAREKKGRRAACAEKVIRCGTGLALDAEPFYARAGEEVRALVTNASGKVRLEFAGRARELVADPQGRARAVVTFELEGVHELRALSGEETARAGLRVYPTRTEALSLTPASARLRPDEEGRALIEGAAHSALVLCVSDRIWWARVVRLNGGWAEVRFRALDAFGQRVELQAFAFRKGGLEHARGALRVERNPHLAASVRAGEIHLRTLDGRGRPVRASVIAVVRETGREPPVALDGLAPGFPAHMEAASSFDFASGGGGVSREMRELPRGRRPPGPAVALRLPRTLKVEKLVQAGPAVEATFALPPRETRGKRELIAYAFTKGGRCAVARTPLAEEDAWGRVCAPGYLVEGDELWAELRLWNDSSETVEPAPGIRGEGVLVRPPRRVSLSGGEALSLPFLIRAVKRGRCIISSAFGSRHVDVLPPGRMEKASHSGVLDEDVSFSLSVPKTARDCRLILGFTPTAADAVAQLRPAEGEDLPLLFARMDDSGGYGWHGSPPDAVSTALASLRLKELLPDSGTMLSRALEALTSLSRAETCEWRRAFAGYALARCGREAGRIGASTPLGLAYAALAEETLGRRERAEKLCRRLEATAERGALGVHWGRKRARFEAGSEELSTAAALRALMRARPRSGLIREACLFLLASRKGPSWGGGLTDREARKALSEFARSRPRGSVAGLTVAASEAGLTRVKVHAAGRTLSKDIVWRRELPGGKALALALDRGGRVRVEVSKTGPGRIPFSAWVEYRTTRAGRGLRVERRYSRLRLRRGERLECVLRVRARGVFERLVVRDFVPAGFEVAEAPGAETSLPEIVYHLPGLEGEAVLRYALRARFRGRFTALAPLAEMEGTRLRGRGRQASLEVGY